MRNIPLEQDNTLSSPAFISSGVPETSGGQEETCRNRASRPGFIEDHRIRVRIAFSPSSNSRATVLLTKKEAHQFEMAQNSASRGIEDQTFFRACDLRRI